MISFAELKKNEEIRTYITMADRSLAALGYTEHSFAHVGMVAAGCRYILETLGYPERMVELAQIAEGIEIPKEKTMGDYAFPCFRLAKTLRKAPNLIAQDVAAKLEGSEILEKVQAVGPYVNMFLNKTWRAQFILGQVDEASIHGHLPPVVVNDQPLQCKYAVGNGCLKVHPVDPQGGPDSCQQLCGAEGLGDIVVGT